jgi:hypothetical protein
MQSDEQAKLERELRLGFLASALAWLWGIIVLLGVACFLAGILSLVYETFFWLRYGFWLELEFEYLFYWARLAPPVVSWVGIQKIIIAVLRWPLWAGLVVSGLSIGLVAVAFGRFTTRFMIRWENAYRELENAKIESKRT